MTITENCIDDNDWFTLIFKNDEPQKVESRQGSNANSMNKLEAWTKNRKEVFKEAARLKKLGVPRDVSLGIVIEENLVPVTIGFLTTFVFGLGSVCVGLILPFVGWFVLLPLGALSLCVAFLVCPVWAILAVLFSIVDHRTQRTNWERHVADLKSREPRNAGYNF